MPVQSGSRNRSPTKSTRARPKRRVSERGPRIHTTDDVRLDSIVTMDSGGEIRSASEDVEQLLGWKPVELIGKNIRTLIPEPRRSALDRYLDRYRNPGRSRTLARTRRFEASAKDGKPVAVELTVSRADVPGRGGPFFVGLIRDVRGRIDTDSDDPESRTRLQRLVTEQTRALATAHLRLQLSDRLISLGTLAAGLGHDLNNVLLPIRARLNALEHAGVSAQAQTHLDEVRRAVSYLQHLSDGLHVLSAEQAAEGKGEVRNLRTDLATWWSQVGVLLRTALPRRMTVRAYFPADLPEASIAPHLLTQVMMNLLVNAGEAMPLRSRHGVVNISAKSENGHLRIDVRDNGRGMGRSVLRRAFDPFFTTKPRAMGTGLGLPIARQALERAGGQITLRSASGAGTTVTLLIPRAGPIGRSPSGPWACVSVSDARLALLAGQILVAAGFRLRPASARSSPPDLWIMSPTPARLRALRSDSAAPRTRARRAAESQHAGGRIVLLGAPPPSARRAWMSLGVEIIEPASDMRWLRTVARRAAVQLGVGRAKEHT